MCSEKKSKLSYCNDLTSNFHGEYLHEKPTRRKWEVQQMAEPLYLPMHKEKKEKKNPLAIICMRSLCISMSVSYNLSQEHCYLPGSYRIVNSNF